MHLTNKKNNSYVIAAASVAVALFTFAIMATAASNMATITPAAATTTTAATPNNTTTTSPSTGQIELSPQPIWQEQQISVSDTPINNTHAIITFTGNGTLTLPNTTESINTTSNSTSLIEFMTNSGQKKETIRTEDGETVSATSYEIANFNPATGEGKGIIITVFNTNSTSTLAPLNGMILAGIHDIQPTPVQSFTFWQWQSGIPLPSAITTQEPPLMNTSATTNATTITADTNATAVAPSEEEVVEEQQQQATPTAPSPLFE